MPAAAALSAADAYAKSAHFREHLAASFPRVAEQLAARLGGGAVDAAGERGEAPSKAPPPSRVRGGGVWSLVWS